LKNKNFLDQKVLPIEVSSRSISDLMSRMSETGFQGRKLAEVCDIFVKMVNDEQLTVFFGFSGSLSVAGQWKIICWLMEHRYIDVLVSTGANISEDIVNAMGFSYWKETSAIDDERLFKEGINRYYDIYGKEDEYIKMTELIAEFILTLNENRNYSSREFLHLFGQWLGRRNIWSIVSVAAKHGVPIF